MFFFFFKQKTAYEIKECDWSSDVCSSDLNVVNKLQSELIASTGTVKENILVIGEDGWKEDRLINRIRDFVFLD